MSVFPSGTEVYAIDAPPLEARGIYFADADVPASLADEIRSVLGDIPGEDEAKDYLEGLDGTGFDRSEIESALFDSEVLESAEDWRIGEAVAQAELETNRGCSFPWSARRDAKNRRASAAGAEMVGFVIRADGSVRFAFGEVKTSSENAAPPSVAWDLRRQVRELRDEPKVVKALIEYLTFRAPNAAWEPHFIEAFKGWIANRKTFAVYGVLVRDVAPNEADLRAMAHALAAETAAPTELELRALYFDAGKIPGTKPKSSEEGAS